MVLIEMAREVGLQPKWAAGTEGGEYKSSCPKCGGVDRFSIQPNKQMKDCMGRYYCRKCRSGGNSINFAREFLGLSFQEAVIRTNATVSESRNIFAFTHREQAVMNPVSIVKPSSLWQQKATCFAAWAHENVLSNSKILEWLRLRGLTIEAVQKYQIGWCSLDIWRERVDWGIENSGEKKLWIPRGLVIPTYDKKGNVIRLKVRRDDYKVGDKVGKYIVVSGSMNGLNIIGDTGNQAMVVTESELDAYAIDYAVGDFVCAVAVGNNLKKPDEATNYHAMNMKQLLICHDNDEAGKVMFERWHHWYRHAQALPAPLGKDIGEAIEQGLKVRPWILQYKWQNHKDQSLINDTLQYIDNQHGLFRSSYTLFEKEIFLGPDSTRARTGELQDGFQLMKELVSPD